MVECQHCACGEIYDGTEIVACPTCNGEGHVDESNPYFAEFFANQGEDICEEDPEDLAAMYDDGGYFWGDGDLYGDDTPDTDDYAEPSYGDMYPLEDDPDYLIGSDYSYDQDHAQKYWDAY